MAPPASPDSKDWINFGVGEAGQVELSNRDKQLAKGVLKTCEDETKEAFERSEHRAKPWYRRVF